MAENLIIKTEPGIGEALPTDSPIYLYISTGPDVAKKTMVDLTSDFYTEESAVKWLDMNGFTNYTVDYVKSEMPAGKVISQSVPAGKSVAVTDPIIILISSGNETNVTVPPSATEEPEDYVSKRVMIELPNILEEDSVISIYRDGVLIEERDVPAGTVSTEFLLSGKETMEFEVTLGTVSWTIEVNFNEFEE